MTEAAANSQIQKLIKDIFDTHNDDDAVMDCESCAGHLCNLAELVSAGADLCQLIPAVEAHLKCCPDCREEWNALVCIIRAEKDGFAPEN